MVIAGSHGRSPKLEDRLGVEVLLLTCLGFLVLISRTHGHKDPYAHSVLAVTDHPVAELTSELGVDLQQVWGGLKYILNILQKYNEGSYIILRDPTKVCFLFLLG